ncbi:MAG: NAD(P)-dependent dehydrogenase (short-subunit alcohol dehydrogenase family) [Candidatus Paceibacteria bacterium]|jgi:NAD(P)-dependent dehydrogenase (short-subunit alcohol dehydrogenase family)
MKNIEIKKDFAKSNKTVLVCGSSRGIGAAVAERYLQEGYRVIGVDRLPASFSSEKYQHIFCDFAQKDFLNSFTKEIKGQKIHKFLYCAAIMHNVDSINPQIADVAELFHVNTLAPWVISGFLLRNGLDVDLPVSSMVFIGSVHSTATSKHRAAYAASKAALSSLARSLSIDFAKEGTRVNVIAFGAVKTKMLSALDSEGLRKLEDRLLVPKIPLPEKITGIVLFLLSEDSSYIVGQTIVADGGALSCLSTEVE